MSSSLITPTFSTDSLGRHTDYVKQLSRQYATLSKLLLEERLSESRSPRPEANEERIHTLRERIRDAWSRADGNPASGKWVLLTRLLRMGSTSGRGAKWVGARADAKSPDCPENGSGWLSTTSESDWREWERKVIEDQRLKSMVETWKKGVEVTESRATRSRMDTMSHPGSSLSQVESGVASDKQTTKSVPATSMDPLKGSAPFGFGVVKRSSQTNIQNGKPHAARNIYAGPDLPDVLEALDSSKGAHKNSLRPPKKQITSGVELSSLHPSFSEAQLLTSTPKPTAKSSLVAQPEVSSPLTPLISSPSKRALLGRSSSLASPPGQRKVGQNDLVQRSPSNRGVATSGSLPVIPSPLRHTTSQPADSDTHDSINTNNKRILHSSHSYPVAEADSRKSKKAKTVSSNHDVMPAPQTPPRDQKTAVPTLTELLASVKKAKKKRPSGVKPQKKEFDHKPDSFTSEPRLQAQASGDGEESVPVDIAEKELPPFFDPSPVDDGGGNSRELGGRAAETRQPEYFYAHINDFNVDPASPAKSLSSIAGASDDDEKEEAAADRGGEIDEFVLDSSFRPLATSTQVQGGHQRHRGPFVSLNNPVITQPDNPSRPSAKGRNATDSWESIYAPRHGSGALPGPSASSLKNKSNDTSFPQLSYNSQFESAVAAQVEKVNKLLQRDVDYDELLSKTPANQERDEEHDDSGDSLLNGSGLVKEGQNRYSYGYGKAFEYDQSF